MMSPPRDAPVDEAYARGHARHLSSTVARRSAPAPRASFIVQAPRSPPRHDLSRSGLGARSACERIVADAPLGADCPVVVAAGLMSGASTCRLKVGPLREPHSI